MDLKLFHRTQRDLATAINKIIDDYWDDKLTEKQMVNTIRELYKNNTTKFIKGKNFTTIVRQQCGKRRLEVVKKILNMK